MPLRRELALLFAARTLAWALWTAGALAAGAWGAVHTPLWLGGLGLALLWVGVLSGTLIVLAQTQRQASKAGSDDHAGRLIGLLGCGVCGIAGLWLAAPAPGTTAAALGATVALATLAALASNTAARWRQLTGRGPIRLPMALGLLAGGAWALPALLPQAPDVASSIGWGGLIALAALATGTLMHGAWRRDRSARPPCDGRWIDAGWGSRIREIRRPAASGARLEWLASQGLRALALAAMLPMMLSLPAMAGLCAAATPGGMVGMLVLHAAAMLLPVAVSGAVPSWAESWHRATLAALLISGGAVLIALDGARGWLLASLLHGAAWGWAWSAGACRGRVGVSPVPMPRLLGWAPLTVLLLGVAVQQYGVAALPALHAVLALLALVTGLAVVATQARRRMPTRVQADGSGPR